jgi:succinate dehydrogenase / fumarate reductase iron-sulfur subunit
MLEAQDALGFGGCTQTGECTAVCPKGIDLDAIARLNHDVLAATLRR